jgi:protease I
MAKELDGLRVAILVEDAFEQIEMTAPRRALDDAGAETVLISPRTDGVRGWKHLTPADVFPTDLPLAQANSADFSALLLPGGVINSDTLRLNQEAVEFVREFARTGKPIAAICHGPWILVEANIVRDRTLTSWPSLKTDIRNAGGNWVDRMMVDDGNLVTSRKPDDIPAVIKQKPPFRAAFLKDESAERLPAFFAGGLLRSCFASRRGLASRSLFRGRFLRRRLLGRRLLRRAALGGANGFLQRASGNEFEHLLGRDFDRLARLRIARDASRAVPNLELAEGGKLDFIARLEHVGDLLQHRFDQVDDLAAREFQLFGELTS